MALEYDQSSLKEGLGLLVDQKKICESVAPLLKKAKDGYVGNVDQVLRSGLKKGDVEDILKAHVKNKPSVAKIETLRRKHVAEVRSAYDKKHKVLEAAMKALDDEQDTALGAFPSGNRDVLSSAAEKFFKDALPQLP